MDVFEIYLKLWERAVNEGAWVHYITWWSPDPPKLLCDPEGAAGWFRANADSEDGQPMIEIYRLDCDDNSTTPSRTRGPEGAHHPPPDLEYELFTLAHEYGHFMSYRGATERTEWDRYTAAANKRSAIMSAVDDGMPDGVSGEEQDERMRSAVYEGLSDDDRQRIVNEEALAWNVGRKVLLELGLKDFRRFDERETKGLHAHRYRLGLEDAWPGDALESLPNE